MNRRAFACGLAALPVAALTKPALAATPKAAAPAVVVYHFASPDCDACQRWDQKYLRQWLNSGEFHRTAYRRIEADSMEEALDPRRWPSEARPVAGSVRETPAFVVMRQGRPVAAAGGQDAWTQVIWPAIQRAAA